MPSITRHQAELLTEELRGLYGSAFLEEVKNGDELCSLRLNVGPHFCQNAYVVTLQRVAFDLFASTGIEYDSGVTALRNVVDFGVTCFDASNQLREGVVRG